MRNLFSIVSSVPVSTACVLAACAGVSGPQRVRLDDALDLRDLEADRLDALQSWLPGGPEFAAAVPEWAPAIAQTGCSGSLEDLSGFEAGTLGEMVVHGELSCFGGSAPMWVSFSDGALGALHTRTARTLATPLVLGPRTRRALPKLRVVSGHAPRGG